MPPTTPAEYRKRREYEEVECPSGDVFLICKPDLTIFFDLAGELPIPALPPTSEAPAPATESLEERERRNKAQGERMLVHGVVAPTITNDVDAAGQPLMVEGCLHLTELDAMDVIVLLRRISIKMGLNTEVAQQAQAFRADEECIMDPGAGAGVPPAAV